MAESSSVANFRQIIEKVFSQQTERIANQTDFNDKYQHLFTKEYQAAIKIVLSTKDAQVLVQLMNAYLELYGRYSYNANCIHYYMSDVTFQWLFFQSAKVDHNHGDLFEIWDKVLKGDTVTDSYNSYKKRFLDLNPTTRSAINAFREEQRKKRMQSKSILDTLKDEYARQYGYPPKAGSDLYDFDPKTSATVKSRLEWQLKKVEPVWNSANGKDVWKEADVKLLNKALDDFSGYIKQEAGGDVLVIFQIIKYLRDEYTPVVTKKEDKKTQRTETYIHDPDPRKATLYYVLYVITCVRLMAIGRAVQLYTRNRFGFTTEEVSWFLQPIKSSYQYYSNMERIITARLDGKVTVEVLADELKAFLNIYQLTKCQLQGIDWVNLKETLKIQNIWTAINDFTEAVNYAIKGNNGPKLETLVSKPENAPTLLHLKTISETKIALNEAGPELGKATVGAGSSVGSSKAYGGITIVYIDPDNHNNIYIEFEGLKPHLFKVNEKFVADHFYGAMIFEIYKSTQGIVIISQLIFMAMGFLPVLIESGFAGLIYEIVLFYSGNKLEEQIEKVSPTAAKIFGLTFMMFAPRPHFEPKMPGIRENPRMVGRDNTGLSDVLNTPPSRGALDSATGTIRAENEIGTITTLEKPTEAQLAKALEQQRQVDIANRELRGTWRRAVDKVRDIAGRAPAVNAENAKIVKAKAAEAIAVEPPLQPAFAGGPMMRTGGKGGMNARGTGGATGGSGKLMSRAESSIRKSAEFKALEEYQSKLSRDMAALQKKEMAKIFDGLANKTLGVTAAEKQIRTLLNNAKEATGEFVADGMIYSNYKVLAVVNVPARSTKVPILDRVYKIQDRDTGQIKFLLSEIKGGERTALGKTNGYKITFRNGEAVWTETGKGTVVQASPEWYWQRIVEIYESPGGKQLAYELLEAMQKGRIEPFVIKSGSEMAPKFRLDSVSGFMSYFKNKQLP